MSVYVLSPIFDADQVSGWGLIFFICLLLFAFAFVAAIFGLLATVLAFLCLSLLEKIPKMKSVFGSIFQLKNSLLFFSFALGFAPSCAWYAWHYASHTEIQNTYHQYQIAYSDMSLEVTIVVVIIDGKSAVFEFVEFGDDLVWLEGDYQYVKSLRQGKLGCEDNCPVDSYLLAPEFLNSVCKSTEVIVVGLASARGRNLDNLLLSQRRASKMATTYLNGIRACESRYRNSAPNVYALALGEFSLFSRDNEDQRPISLINILAKEDGIDVSEALWSALNSTEIRSKYRIEHYDENPKSARDLALEKCRLGRSSGPAVCGAFAR